MELQNVDATVDASSDAIAFKDIRVILKAIKQNWIETDIVIKQMSGGFVNIIYKVQHSGDQEIIVRVFTEISYSFTMPERMASCMIAAHAADIGAEVLASFNNGIVYEYQAGEPVHPDNETYRTVEFRKKMVQMLVRYNTIDMRTVQPQGEIVPRLTEDIERAKHIIPDDFSIDAKIGGLSEILSSKAALVAELEWLYKTITQLECPLSFMHGDAWWGNILYDGKTDSVKLIDLDVSGPNPLPGDIAGFIGMAQMRTDPWSMEQLSEAEQKLYCRTYIEEWRKVEGGSDSDVGDGDVDILYALTKPFYMMILLHGIITTLPHMEGKPIDDQLFGFIRASDQQYKEIKTMYSKLMENNPDLFVKGWRP